METIEIFGDGGSRGNPGPGASAFVVLKNNKEIFKQSKYLGITTNNVAEYNSVIMALEWVRDNFNSDSKTIYFKLDSELITKQIIGSYKVRSLHLIPLNQKSKFLIDEIKSKIIFTSVPRSQNKTADYLVNEELDKQKMIRPNS